MCNEHQKLLTGPYANESGTLIIGLWVGEPFYASLESTFEKLIQQLSFVYLSLQEYDLGLY